jgi:hypothetical protein
MTAKEALNIAKRKKTKIKRLNRLVAAKECDATAAL